MGSSHFSIKTPFQNLLLGFFPPARFALVWQKLPQLSIPRFI